VGSPIALNRTENVLDRRSGEPVMIGLGTDDVADEIVTKQAAEGRGNLRELICPKPCVQRVHALAAESEEVGKERPAQLQYGPPCQGAGAGVAPCEEQGRLMHGIGVDEALHCTRVRLKERREGLEAMLGVHHCVWAGDALGARGADSLDTDFVACLGSLLDEGLEIFLP
jgi:hypothetical protein